MAFNAASLSVPAPPAGDWQDGNVNWLKEVQDPGSRGAAPKAVKTEKLLIGYKYDSAFGLLLKNLVPIGLRGFILAAILGAVTSTLAALLNAVSTIFTMDIYKEYFSRGASQASLVLVGRISVVVAVIFACLLAPLVDNPRFGGMFNFIQEFQGFLSPGVLGVFLFGLFVPRAPRACGIVGLLISPAVYGILMWLTPELAFLHRMTIAFVGVLVVLGLMTALRPLPAPVQMPEPGKIDLTPSRGAAIAGIGVILVTIALYAYFW
jgi:SSS family solute:Na+ symporter